MPQNLTLRQKEAYPNSKVNLTAGTYLLKSAPGVIGKLFISTAGTASAWGFYDCAATANASATTLALSLAFGNSLVAAGSILILDFPCQTGIVITWL